MKKYREKWDEDIVKYVFYAYEQQHISCCKNCNIYEKLYFNMKYTYIPNSSYVKTYEGEIIHLDSVPKKCNNYCIYYY